MTDQVLGQWEMTYNVTYYLNGEGFAQLGPGLSHNSTYKVLFYIVCLVVFHDFCYFNVCESASMIDTSHNLIKSVISKCLYITEVGRRKLSRYRGISKVNSLRPSEAYMRQWSNHWTLGNKLQWNFNRNSNIFIQENALQNVVCEMASILSRPQCVKGFRMLHGCY